MRIKFEPNYFFIGLHVICKEQTMTMWYVIVDRTYHLCIIPFFPIVWEKSKLISRH